MPLQTEWENFGVPIVRKVVIYVLTRKGSVLTFTQRNAPDAGRQVPAGTVELGEDPAFAAKRELFEETGYEASAQLTHFAESYADMQEYKPEVHLRSWYFVEAERFPPAPWTHVERREDGLPDIIADFVWTPISEALQTLVAGQSAQLELAWDLRNRWREILNG